MLVIRKRPSEKYLVKRTFCMTEDEFKVINDPNVKSEIRVFNHSGEVVVTIPKYSFDDLIYYQKKNLDGDLYYIVEFDSVHPFEDSDHD